MIANIHCAILYEITFCTLEMIANFYCAIQRNHIIMHESIITARLEMNSNGEFRNLRRIRLNLSKFYAINIYQTHFYFSGEATFNMIYQIFVYLILFQPLL